jgi:hypothetical protein
MTAAFNLWSCPLIAVADKALLAPEGLPPDQFAAALNRFLVDAPEPDRIPDHSIMLNQWIASGLDPFAPLTPDLQDIWGARVAPKTLFEGFVRLGNPSLVAALLKTPTAPTPAQLSAMPMVFFGGEPRVGKGLPEKCGNALTLAAWTDNSPLLEVLLGAGLSPNTPSDLFPPLHVAKSHAVTRRLIEAGANPDAKDPHGILPEHSLSSFRRLSQAHGTAMRGEILRARATLAVSKGHVEGLTAPVPPRVVDRLFASVWKADEDTFVAYLDALTRPMEDIRHRTHPFSLLAWTVIRATGSCKDSGERMMRRLLQAWPVTALTRKSSTHIPDLLWLWAHASHATSPARHYLKEKGLLRDPASVLALRLQASPGIDNLAPNRRQNFFPATCALLMTLKSPADMVSFEQARQKSGHPLDSQMRDLLGEGLLDTEALLGHLADPAARACVLSLYEAENQAGFVAGQPRLAMVTKVLWQRQGLDGAAAHELVLSPLFACLVEHEPDLALMAQAVMETHLPAPAPESRHKPRAHL